MMTHTRFLLIGLLLLATGSTVFGQKKLRFGIQLHLNGSSANIGKDSRASEELQEIYQEEEVARLSSAVHFFGEYAILPRLHTYLGVGYQNHGHRLREIHGSYINPQNGGFEEGSAKVRIVMHYLEFPFGLKTYLSRHVYLNLGASMNVYFSDYRRRIFQFDGGDYDNAVFWVKHEDPRDINWSLRPGLGLEFGKSDGLGWYVEGTYQYMLKPLSNWPRINRRLESLGMTAGVKF